MNAKYFVLICSLLIVQAAMVKPDSIAGNENKLREDVQALYKEYPYDEKDRLSANARDARKKLFDDNYLFITKILDFDCFKYHDEYKKGTKVPSFFEVYASWFGYGGYKDLSDNEIDILEKKLCSCIRLGREFAQNQPPLADNHRKDFLKSINPIDFPIRAIDSHMRESDWYQLMSDSEK